MVFGLFKTLLSGKVDVLARYEVLREAISGTMSKFYMARDRQSGRIVGLKILDPQQLAAHEARLKGLKRPSEGEIGLRLDHPHIVKTFAHGLTTRGEQFVVLEFLEGPGLNSLIIGRSPLLVGKRPLLLRQAAQAIAAVHEAGFIHRDICPRNFVADREVTTLKLIDFGLTVPDTEEFQRPGNRTGTPAYMAPEVVRRKRTDKRLDIFSFGVTAYELTTFELPWKSGKDGQAALAHDSVAPTPIETYRPHIHPRLAQAIMSCLSADPQQRPQSMDDFLKQIACVEHEDHA